MAIPLELSQQTYQIEYLPGTYGDFVCGIISYSIDEFYDHSSAVGLKWSSRYWNDSGSSLERNRYPMSLRGSGYEHVENYTEFMLSHHIFSIFSNVYTDPAKKILFNTHPSVLTHLEDTQRFRTVNNKYKKTDCKFLMIDMSFESLFQSACNEYLSSNAHINDKENNSKRELFERFFNRIRLLDLVKEVIPEEKIFNIDNPREMTPETIEQYGTVDLNKFKHYHDDYCKRKLYMLEYNTKVILEKMKTLEPEKYKYFTHAYEHREVLTTD